MSVIVFILHVPDSPVDEGSWSIRKTLVDLIYSIQMYQVSIPEVLRFIVHHYSDQLTVLFHICSHSLYYGQMDIVF